MIFSRIVRSDGEKIYMAFKNTYSTAALTNGQSVMIDYVTDKDGVGVTKATAQDAKAAGLVAAGVVAQASIAVGSYGLVQVYGYHASVRCRAITGGSPVVATGTMLALLRTVFCLESIPSSYASTVKVYARQPMAFALSATAGFTTAAIPAFIKNLG